MGPKSRRGAHAAQPDVDGSLGSAAAQQIIAALEERLSLEDWRARMSRLEAAWGPAIYSALFFVLAHLDLDPGSAKRHWHQVLDQWQELGARLGDGVDLRVAVLHYFLRIERKLENPAIVEIRILKQTQDSASLDDLTGLRNFRFFQERLRDELERVRRYRTPLSLLMVDVDDFKAFNDTRGHLAGNIALRRLARVLRRSVREVDVVARYGGEEFAILLPSTPKAAATKLADKLRRALQREGIGRGDVRGRTGLTVSVGVACAPGDAADADTLVRRADRALYVAKSLGKNRAEPFSQDRRECTRVSASLIGGFSPLAERTHSLTTRDLSESGLLFTTDQIVAVGHVLLVRLCLPPSGETAEGVVRVTRVTRTARGYEVAAALLAMERPHERRLRALLARLRERPPLAGAARRTS